MVLSKKFSALSRAIIAVILIAGFTISYFWLIPQGVDNHSVPGTTSESVTTIKPVAKLYPSDWAWLQRTFPFGTAEKLAHLEALQQAQKMRATARQVGKTGNKLTNMLREARWQFAGPENIGGRVSDIEYDPIDPAIVYAGAATGGVFKSMDGGWTWQPIFDDQAVLSIGDIAVDPVDPNYLYVGTGEANGGHNNFPGAGIYRSTDRGLSWKLVGLEATTSIGRIVIDPINPERIFVAAVGCYFAPDPDRGVYRSDDRGDTWDKILFVSDSTGAIDIILNPQNTSLLLAAMWERVRGPHSSHLYGASSGIYRTTDGGDNWSLLGVDNGLPESEEQAGRIGLALCTTQPNNVYALYTNSRYSYMACYKSDDFGLNWIQVDTDMELETGFGNFSWYFGNIRVHPREPELIFVLDVAFMRSTDGGDSWPIIYGYGNPFWDFHVDHHALAFHPFHPDTIINGNDGGINISYDAGETWTKIALLPVTQFYEITIDQSNPERLYGGTQDNGTLRTVTGAINDWEQIYGGDGFYVIVDPTNPDIIYAESQRGGLGKSTNGGLSFSTALNGIPRGEPTNWSTPVVMAPNNPDVLYYGTNRIYRTVNGARFWQPISPNLTKQLDNSGLGTVTTIAVAASDSNVIYAGTDDGNVWVTDDYGLNWRQVNDGLPFRWVTRVAVDPTDAAMAYVTFSGLKWRSPQPHVFRTVNMGASWEDISNNLPDAPVNVIMIDPVYPNNLYLGSDVGCFFSPDYGQNWEVPGQGMPIVPVYSLDGHRQLRYLVAGTHGRSMYSMSLEDIVPVTLSTFYGNEVKDGIELRWQTESETNNLGFYVERKSRGTDFREIGFVKGTGTTAQPHHYVFFDNNVTAGQYYYRLKQVDVNGGFSYSPITKIMIKQPTEFELAQNFPNPFNGNTTITYRIPELARITIKIYNDRGQLVRTLVDDEKYPGSYQVVWRGTDNDGHDVASALYFYEMKTTEFRQVRQLIYLK